MPQSKVSWRMNSRLHNPPLCAQPLQLCPTLCDSMDCSSPGSSVHGILQARILEWVFPFPNDLPNPGIEPWSPTLQNLYHLSHQGSPVEYSVQFSHSVMSDPLQSLGLDHTRLPYPSPTPGACSNSCPSSR